MSFTTQRSPPGPSAPGLSPGEGTLVTGRWLRPSPPQKKYHLPAQVGESLFHTDRWVPPTLDELYYLRPQSEMDNEKFGLQYYV